MSNLKVLVAALLCVVGVMLAVFVAFAEVINSGVAFQENGLPAGTPWAVVCNGTLYNSTSNIITITFPPGTYKFTVPDVAGYTVTPQSGNVTAILDPIFLTPITFSPAIPEFTINLQAAVLALLLALAGAALAVKMKSWLRI